MEYGRLLLLAMCAIMTLLMVTEARQYDEDYKDKRNGGKTFFVSRYGRSGSSRQHSGSGSGDSRAGDSAGTITSRNDKQFEKFFIGSRYGKRVPSFMNGMAPVDADDVLSTLALRGVATADDTQLVQDNMSCIYTGVANFYRCLDRKEISSNIPPQLDSTDM